LNDLYILNVLTKVWSQVRTAGQPPQARAGMSLSYVSGLLYLFGGSGHTTRCFNDVHVFDPVENTWYEGTPMERVLTLEEEKSYSSSKRLSIDGGSSSSTATASTTRNTTLNNSTPLTVGQVNRNGCVQQPERRAGHAAVTVGTRVFIFGGACGTQYYGKGKCFILSTDAAPQMTTKAVDNLTSQNVKAGLSGYFNSEQFSDVSFAFHEDNRVIHAHRVLLTVFSEHFKRLFTSGMRECHEKVVKLPPDVSYDVFRALIEYIYTNQLTLGPQNDVVWQMELLRCADQFCVDPVKRLCEERISKQIEESNVTEILSEAQRMQAESLVRYCEWLLRQLDRSEDPTKEQ